MCSWCPPAACSSSPPPALPPSSHRRRGGGGAGSGRPRRSQPRSVTTHEQRYLSGTRDTAHHTMHGPSPSPSMSCVVTSSLAFLYAGRCRLKSVPLPLLCTPLLHLHFFPSNSSIICVYIFLFMLQIVPASAIFYIFFSDNSAVFLSHLFQ